MTQLGVYTDQGFRREGDVLSTHRSFTRFVMSMPPRVDAVVLFGRLDPTPGRAPYPLPSEGVRFVALPHYPSVTKILRVLSAVRGSCTTFSRELDRLDAVWIFGPSPMALVFAAIARRRGVPLFLGVRQDYPTYIASRLPSPRWRWAIPVAHVMERLFRRLARRAPTVALGSELARNYAGASRVLSTGFSLVRADELTAAEDAHEKSWDGDLQLVSVSRLDVEKNPLLLIDILAGLRRENPRWRMVVAGEGPLRPAMEEAIRARGLEGHISLPGEVPNGPPLWQLYRDSHAFVHVSHTEGLPQVLFEAQAAGLPIVATAVGGVASALGDGSDAILMPPRDADAGVRALQRLVREPALRTRLIDISVERARDATLEAQLDRIADFLHLVPTREPRDATAV